MSDYIGLYNKARVRKMSTTSAGRCNESTNNTNKYNIVYSL